MYNAPSKTMLEAREMYHHGILGQKHGERRAAHYPLNQEDFSPAELKAGAKESAWAQGEPDDNKQASKLKPTKEKKKLFSRKDAKSHGKKPTAKGSDTENNQNESEKESKPLIKNKEYYKHQKASELSDQEIREALSRIAIEDQYDKLTGQNQVVVKGESIAKKAMKKFVAKSMESLAEDLAGKVGRNLSQSISDSLFGSESDRAKAKEMEKLRSEKQTLKAINKKVKRAEKKGKPIEKVLSSRELTFISDRHDKEEKAKKGLGIWEDPTSKSDARIKDYAKKSMKFDSNDDFMKWAVSNIKASDAKNLSDYMNNLYKVNSKLSYDSKKSNHDDITKMKYSNLKDASNGGHLRGTGKTFIREIYRGELHSGPSVKSYKFDKAQVVKKSKKKHKK